MDAVDRLFGEFELVFHNQYHKAYPTPEKLNYAKKLWFDYLRAYQPEVILAAAHRAIQASEFLPSIATLLKHCGTAAAPNLPDAYSAYREACLAPSPKANQHWSHPAVFHAGQLSGWHLLANQPENRALPVFTRHYQALCEQVARGERLAPPNADKLPEGIAKPLPRSENRQRLDQLRKKSGL